MSRKRKVQEHYDKVANHYDKKDVTYIHVRDELFKNISFGENEIILDVGCGTGKFLFDLGKNSMYVVFCTQQINR